MKNENPFINSFSLGQWVKNILSKSRIDTISEWRMLEYWIQVEIYRNLLEEDWVSWKPVGDYEQPYYTRNPHLGSKSNWKWADLVIWRKRNGKNEMLWFELKDLGRSKERLDDNIKQVAFDTVALKGFDAFKTLEGWLEPPEVIRDKGRIKEWKSNSFIFDGANHRFAQVILIPLHFADTSDEHNNIKTTWNKFLMDILKNTNVNITHNINVSTTQKFSIFSIIM